MFGKLVGPDIAEMVQQRQFAQLRSALLGLKPPTVAEIFEDLSPEDIGVIFRLLPREFAADIFEYLSFENQETLLHSLGNEQVATVLNAMAPDDRTALLEELPGSITKRLLALLTPDERKVATELLGYHPKSVGRLMTPEFVAVSPEWTVGQVMDHIRKVGRDKETLNVIYVLDHKGYLIDDIRLRELVLWDPQTPLSEKMNREFIALRADQDQEEAVKAFKEYDRVALPVVDSSGFLVGIVTVDDILDIQEEEVTEDIQKMGAVEVLDAPYMAVGLPTMIRKRAGWLSILFVGEMFTQTAMGKFQDELERAVVLSLFLPLIISSGGNSGSQASSLLVRALALGDVRLRDWWRVLVRELTSGLALGAVLGTIVLIRILVWQALGWDYGPHYMILALTVSFSVIGVVMYGTLMGAMLPLVLRRVGLDPATSSAPFVATLVDVTGIIIYFTIAALMLRGTLL
ncbi:MAG: magnesium transporter [Planctomycetes bacterium]|nr:magnesium transporter [Planctomycetota bacterium]MBI3832749.1 magnesium transporter [Planctomycetota bacterium]